MSERILIASDHAGFELKQRLRDELRAAGLDVADLGPADATATDYADYAHPLAQAVAEGRARRGVLLCGTGLGMSYVHIPVDFKAPTSQDFRAFCRVMDAFDDRPVFVHCAANMRVSAFVFLYRVLSQQTDLADAERDLHTIWRPDETWSRFIQDELKSNDPA